MTPLRQEATTLRHLPENVRALEMPTYRPVETRDHVFGLRESGYIAQVRWVTPNRVEDVVNAAKLYVGNLSYSTSEDSLRKAFEAHGEVASVNLITDRDSGRPKGFAFVEMGSPDQAQAAKDALNGTQLDGRALNVDVAKEQAPRAPRPGGGYGGGGGGGYGGGGGNRRW